jgi:malonyl-CoA/methylmalonyl-CoA synthetase
VRGPNVFKGYWGAPEKTAAEFREDGFFITGDMGAVDAQGYVHILGRSKDLVISGGLNVYPKEIEDRILEIEGVADCAVIGVAHRDFGEAVVAVVVGSGLTEADIIARLSEGLAKFKQPKRVIFVDELPRNAMAKVQKNVLRQTYADLFPT